ncbi:MAG: alpha/beta fold hydrolase [Gammaproteobacteria bacterium]
MAMTVNSALNLIGGLPDRVLRQVYFGTAAANAHSRDQVLRDLDFYDVDNWPAATRPFFSIPDVAPASRTLQEREVEGGSELLLSYPSRYAVRNPAIASEFAAHVENLTGYLRIWRHHPTERRPLVFCVHGYMMGDPAMARRLFKIEKLFARGMDVALYTQPHHWRRALPSQWRNPMFRAANVPLSLEHLGQTVHDLHSCTLLLRQMGWDRLGMVGASLGGLTCALYATQPVDVDFMFIAVPLVSVERLFNPDRARYSFPVDDELRARVHRAGLLGSPLSYRPAYDLEKIQVVAHEGDQLCELQPIEDWVAGWGIKNYTRVPGGHDLYFDRKIRGNLWRRWLQDAGYTIG